MAAAPLRKVVSRNSEGEALECGHIHENTYRSAKRRRCKSCIVTVTADQTLCITELTEPSDQPRCAYCHDDLDNKVTACGSCHTIVHRDCAKEMGSKCPILGCSGKFNAAEVAIALAPRAMIRILPKPAIQRSWLGRLVSWVGSWFCALAKFLRD